MTFYFKSEDNAALTPLVSELAKITAPNSKVAMENSPFKISDLVGGVAPVDGLPATIYSTYDGSLTTPGCNEVVHWINFLTPIKISASQLAMFRYDGVLVVIVVFNQKYSGLWMMFMVKRLWTTSDLPSLSMEGLWTFLKRLEHQTRF